MGVEAKEDGSFQLYLAYPNLQDENASENALSSDVYWEGTVPDLLQECGRCRRTAVKSGSESSESVAAESADVCLRCGDGSVAFLF